VRDQSLVDGFKNHNSSDLDIIWNYDGQ
jgi:hypothetical protein